MSGYKVSGETIRELRNKHGWIAAELAEKAEVNVQYLYRIERNEERPSFDVLVTIARVLGVPVGILFETDHNISNGTLTVGSVSWDVPAELVESLIKIINGYNETR